MSYLLIALTLAPAVAISGYIYWRDKFDREPLRLMLWCFIGGCISVIPTLGLELGAGILINMIPTHLPVILIKAFIGVAFIEEGCKLIFLRTFAYKSKHFDEPYDGITYAVMVSMGFATIENFLYVFDSDMPLRLALLRMFTAVPAHATFAILMGYFVGMAKFKGRNKGLYIIIGLLAATLFHGAYDYFLMQKILPELAIGALASFIVAIYLSFRAIHLHQHNSPFNATNVYDITTQNRMDDLEE